MSHNATVLNACINSGKVLYVIVPCFVAYLGISMEQVVIYVTFVVIDIILGTIVAKTIKKEKITSRQWDNSVIKKVIKMLLPFLLIVTWIWLHMDLSWLWAWILWYFIMTEAYSILWHIYSIYTGELYEEEDAFIQSLRFIWKLMKRGKSKMEKSLEDKVK